MTDMSSGKSAAFRESDSAADRSVDDGEAFVRLLMENEPHVRSFLRGLLPSWNDVDEVIQEASLVAWRKFDQFEEGTAFGGWFLTISRFEALKHRRKLAKSPLIFAEDVWNLLADESASENQSDVRRQHLEGCLNKLAPEKRDVLLKVHSPGIAIKKIAQQSGKGEQAFYKSIQRLRATLLNCVSKSMADTA